MDFIIAENISYERNGTVLLSDFNLKVKKGSIYGILCEDAETNTLISELIIGNEIPKEGKITVDSLSPAEKRDDIKAFTGIVSSEYRMYSYMTAYNNLLLFGKLKAGDLNYIPDRASYLMHELNVWFTRDKNLSDVDSSSKRKLSIARALITRPCLLILDEPFNKLDRGSQNDVKEFIKNITLKEDITVIICSENAEELSVCDEFSILKNGKCIASGDLNALKEFSGLKNKAYIRTENLNLEETELEMKKESEHLYFKVLEKDESIGSLIKKAVNLDADIKEAGIKEPSLLSICTEILNLNNNEIEEGEE